MENLLGTSPSSVSGYFGGDGCYNVPEKLTDSAYTSLVSFEQQIPRLIEERNSIPVEQRSTNDPILNAMRNVNLSPNEYRMFAKFDYNRAYTRNLVGTDSKTYTLLVLCWTPGHASQIHDHPCDGCWVKVLQGQVRESRYVQISDSHLECSRDIIGNKGDLLYIEDSIGLHKVGNPSSDIPAVTLHLYSPPFQECNIWVDENHSPNHVSMSYFSEYGEKKK